MSELKAIRGGDIHDDVEFGYGDEDRASVLYYLKSEADKVFAELEERHKMEVEQLLIEIAELKAQKAQAEDDCAYWKMREGNAVNAMHETEEACMFLTKSERHQKHKRCLAMARWCHNQREIYERDSYNWELEDDAVNSLRNKASIMRKWRKRWLELSEKFKEAK